MNNRRNNGGSGRDSSGRGKPVRRDGESSPGYSSNRPRTTSSTPRGQRPPTDDRPYRTEGRFNREDRAPGGRRTASRSDRFSSLDERGPGRGRFAPKGGPSSPKKPISNVKIVSDLQVTDGNHRGKYLKDSPSPRGKVMNRRLREAMFKVLLKRLKGRRFLDLGAGTGMIGIEAISRGALIGSMVERGARLFSLIKKNLEKCEIKEGHGEVFHMEAVPFLKQMAKRGRRWDIVFFAPPYSEDYDEVTAYLKRGTPVEKGGAVVIGHHAEMSFPEELGVLKQWRVVTEGDDAISFYARKS